MWTAEQRARHKGAVPKALVDVHCAGADAIHVVLDNLSTHSAAALYDTFEPDEARRILRKLEFHYVPKHASWLNIVEIGVPKRQCLALRIADRPGPWCGKSPLGKSAVTRPQRKSNNVHGGKGALHARPRLSACRAGASGRRKDGRLNPSSFP